jgi:hypothetical protein
MVAANFAAGTFTGDLPDPSLRQWGISHKNIVKGKLYRLITGTFLSHNVAMFMRQICFAAAVIGYYEWGQGTFRAVSMFIFIDIFGSLIVLFAVLSPLDGASWAGFNGVTSTTRRLVVSRQAEDQPVVATPTQSRLHFGKTHGRGQQPGNAAHVAAQFCDTSSGSQH